MDIVVHGTKGGRQIFTPKKLGGLLDVNSDSSKASAIGKEAYALRFIDKTIIFSKYKIIRDVRGDKRTGFLAFSLFLPNDKKLSGSDVLSFLNEVSEEYCKKYIPENDNNLKDVREDWAFLERFAEKYKAMLRPVSSEDIEYLLSGSQDDAFIYYENDEKLQSYFDAPFQDLYSQYRQVLFVNEELKDKPENPLNALRHSEDNLSGKIDLENPKYKLIFDQTTTKDVRIDVKVNRVARRSNSIIRRKDQLEINWSKPYCKPITMHGSLTEITNEFIDVNSAVGTVKVKNIMLDALVKTISFNVKDWKGNLVSDAKIICKSHTSEKVVENNQVTFKGEDFGKRWSVSASKDRIFSDDRLINFEKEVPGDAGSVDIVLNKHELKITVHEGSKDGDVIKDCRINKKEFIGNEIEKTHKISIESREHQSCCFDYHPLKSEINQHVVLQKRQSLTKPIPAHSYYVSAGEHGTLKGGDSCISNHKNGKDVRHCIVPNKGYKFTRFEEQVGTLVAQYEKKRYFCQNKKIIAGSLVGVLAVGFGIWLFFFLLGKDEIEQTQEPGVDHIMAYIKGSSLILDTLKGYKGTLNEGASEEVLRSIDSAIKKRESINKLGISELESYYFYPEQQKLKDAIDKVQSSQYDFKKRFGDVSTWSLDQIADSIVSVSLSDKQFADSETVDELVVEEKKKRGWGKEEDEMEVKVPVQTEQKKTDNSAPENTNDSKGIIQELQSDKISKSNLEKLNSEENAEYKKSINLYIKFWDLVTKENVQKSDFDDLKRDVIKDKYLKSSKLKEFLDNICKDARTFSNKYKKKSSSIKRSPLLTLEKLNRDLSSR